MISKPLLTLKDVAEVVMGQSPAGEECNRDGRGLPLLNGPTEFGPTHPYPTQFTTDPKKRAIKGDLLFCVRGSTTGRMNWAEQNYAIGRGIAAIRHKTSMKLQPLVRAAIEHSLPALLQSATGSTFPNVSGPQLSAVPFPDIVGSDAEAIAATLGALDDKIELNRRMNETLEAMARALFRDWFVDFGPTRAKLAGIDPYLSADLWSLFPDRLDGEGKPLEWSYEPLLDQAEWVNGAAYKNMHFSGAPDALPVIKIAELKNGVTGTTQRTATDLGARYLIDDGELLFSWSGNPDTSIDTFLWTGGKAWLNQHIFAVRQNGKHSKPYLHTLLKFLKPEFSELARNKQTTGLGHVTKADMQRMLVCAASPEVHRALDRLIEPIFNQALGLQTETRTLAQTRDLLLPRLMSGELRLAEVEKINESVS